MSLEYCENCESDVKAHLPSVEDNLYSWICPICGKLHQIEYTSKIGGATNG